MLLAAPAQNRRRSPRPRRSAACVPLRARKRWATKTAKAWSRRGAALLPGGPAGRRGCCSQPRLDVRQRLRRGAQRCHRDFFFHAAAEQGWSSRCACWPRRRPAQLGVPGVYDRPRAAADGAAAAAGGRRASDRDSARCAAPHRRHRQTPRGAVQALADAGARLIKVESNYDTIALSPKKCQGPDAADPRDGGALRRGAPYDAEQNIRGGMAYLSWLMAYFEGNVPWWRRPTTPARAR